MLSRHTNLLPVRMDCQPSACTPVTPPGLTNCTLESLYFVRGCFNLLLAVYFLRIPLSPAEIKHPWGGRGSSGARWWGREGTLTKDRSSPLPPRGSTAGKGPFRGPPDRSGDPQGHLSPSSPPRTGQNPPLTAHGARWAHHLPQPEPLPHGPEPGRSRHTLHPGKPPPSRSGR